MSDLTSTLSKEDKAKLELMKLQPNAGDLLYFRIAKKESRRNAKEIKFKGHGFGVFLGHLPMYKPEPQPDDLFRMMGAIGFLTFDDVASFLGEEAAQKCVKAYEEKYYGPEAQARAQTIPDSPVDAPERPKLVDMNGTPINSNDETPLQEAKDETSH